MPLPLAPLLPIALRLGVLALAGYAARSLLAGRTHTGRTDQRAEDALDDLPDGIASHRPRDAEGQSNAAFRLRRTVQINGGTYELDAGAIARLRLRKIE
jgi:hypothetical protein